MWRWVDGSIGGRCVCVSAMVFLVACGGVWWRVVFVVGGWALCGWVCAVGCCGWLWVAVWFVWSFGRGVCGMGWVGVCGVCDVCGVSVGCVAGWLVAGHVWRGGCGMCVRGDCVRCVCRAGGGVACAGWVVVLWLVWVCDGWVDG